MYLFGLENTVQYFYFICGFFWCVFVNVFVVMLLIKCGFWFWLFWLTSQNVFTKWQLFVKMHFLNEIYCSCALPTVFRSCVDTFVLHRPIKTWYYLTLGWKDKVKVSRFLVEISPNILFRVCIFAAALQTRWRALWRGPMPPLGEGGGQRGRGACPNYFVPNTNNIRSTESLLLYPCGVCNPKVNHF